MREIVNSVRRAGNVRRKQMIEYQDSGMTGLDAPLMRPEEPCAVEQMVIAAIHRDENPSTLRRVP